MQDIDNKVKGYLARIIFDSGKNEEAAALLKPLIEQKVPFQGEDRDLLINVYDSCINPLRIAIMNIKEVAPEHAPLVTDKLNIRLLHYLDEIISEFNNDIIPSTAGDEENRAKYSRYLADFLRYKLDCVSNEEKPPIAALSRKNYEKSIELYRSLPALHVEDMTQTLINYTILLADHLGQIQKAIDILSKEHKEASVSLDKYPEDLKNKVQEFIGIMADNLRRWEAANT